MHDHLVDYHAVTHDVRGHPTGPTGAVRIERTFTGDKWKLYRLDAVENGIHPVHGGPTSVSHVWIPVGDYPSREAAHVAAMDLANVTAAAARLH